MSDGTEREAGRILHEAELVHPTVDALTRALIAATPPSWRAAQLVISFGGGPPVISSPEGHPEELEITPAMNAAIIDLDRMRVERRTGWTGGVVMARLGDDDTWSAAMDWHYGGMAPAAPGRLATPAEIAPPPAAGDRARHDVLLARAEAELAAGQPLDAMASLGEALVALPGETFERPEAGWIFVRMAGIRLGLGDAKGAARNAQSALRCAGWAGDARALLRLGQAQQAIGDRAASATIVAAYRAGGDAWFASVAPELLAWARTAAAAV